MIILKVDALSLAGEGIFRWWGNPDPQLYPCDLSMSQGTQLSSGKLGPSMACSFNERMWGEIEGAGGRGEK
jgi:hypothetical protein